MIDNSRASASLPATSSGPNPGDFPLGSMESRAAARAQCERRELLRDNAVTVVFSTGLPEVFGGVPVIEAPDSVAYYSAPDGSTIKVTRRFWEANGRDGLTIDVHQGWPDGRAYDGDCLVESLSDLERLARRVEA